MTGSFELKNATNGRFVFNLKAGNGEIILTSGVYATKDDAMAGIASVKANAVYLGQYEQKTVTSEQPYFVLKAANGEVLGRSEMYGSPTSVQRGIKSVMRNAPVAPVKDLVEIEALATK